MRLRRLDPDDEQIYKGRILRPEAQDIANGMVAYAKSIIEVDESPKTEPQNCEKSDCQFCGKYSNDSEKRVRRHEMYCKKNPQAVPHPMANRPLNPKLRAWMEAKRAANGQSPSALSASESYDESEGPSSDESIDSHIHPSSKDNSSGDLPGLRSVESWPTHEQDGRSDEISEDEDFYYRLGHWTCAAILCQHTISYTRYEDDTR